MKRINVFSTTLVLAAGWLTACGAGAPIRLHVDEFTMPISLDDTMNNVFAELQAQGVFPASSQSLPVLWPSSLPDVQYQGVFTTPPIPIDLNPPAGSPDAGKYGAINSVKDAIQRIEINRFILRLEQNTMTAAVPAFDLQIADDPDADPADRFAWRTIGNLPAAPAGYVGDLELTFVPSGESYLESQLSDQAKSFALRVTGVISLDTTQSGRMPAGAATARMILVATFYLKPDKLLEKL